MFDRVRRAFLCLVVASGLGCLGPAMMPLPAKAQDGATGTTGTSDGRLNWPSAWPPQVNGTDDAGRDVGRDGDAAAARDTADPSSTAQPAADTAGPAAAEAAPSSIGQVQGETPAQTRPSQAPSTAPQAPVPGATPVEPPRSPVPQTGAAPGQTQKAAQPANGQPAEQPQPGAPPAAQPPAQPAPPAQPPAATPVQLKASVSKDVEAAKALASRFDTLEKAVERVRERDDELTSRLPQAEAISLQGQQVIDRLRPELADIRSQIEKLGKPPEDGKPEAPEIAGERQRLNTIAAEIDGAIKTVELTQVKARQLISRIQGFRLDNFRRGLFARSPSILSPTLWRDGLSSMPSAIQQLRNVGENWIGRAQEQWPQVAAVLVAAAVFGFGLQALSRRLRNNLRHHDSLTAPSFAERALVASLEAPLRLIPKVGAAAVIYAGFDQLGLLYLQVGDLAAALLKAIIIIAAGTAYTTAYLQPARPNWRVIDLGDPAAWRVRALIRAVTILFAVDVFVRELIGALFLPLPVNILWASIASLAFAAVFVRGVRTDIVAPEGASPRVAFLTSRMHKGPLGLATIAIMVGVLVGYTALAHYTATRLVIVAGAIFLLVIFYLANRAIAAGPDALPAKAAADPTAMPIEMRRRLARGLSILLDIVLFLIAIPFSLLAIGFDPAEITTLTNRALFGFEIAGVEISLAKIGFAIGLFAAILFLSGMLQRWLGETVLHPSRTEQGLGNSIRTGVGYLGFIAAALAGLSYAGLDITNLAIVAGALSVGIGFGLQSIVNNFVSGLILLVERPINVGDWIKVGDVSGYVRRISVRSTEIETFERASVIIPNSELITGTVTNMTLRNALGRITIPVGVSYDTDPDLVQKLLLEAVGECKTAARHPAPFVVFEDFGASSLDFSLRFFVPDVNSSLSAQTEVRKAILMKFRENGIEIPFPQSDLNVRDLPKLREALKEPVPASDAGSSVDGANSGPKAGT